MDKYIFREYFDEFKHLNIVSKILLKTTIYILYPDIGKRRKTSKTTNETQMRNYQGLIISLWWLVCKIVALHFLLSSHARYGQPIVTISNL